MYNLSLSSFSLSLSLSLSFPLSLLHVHVIQGMTGVLARRDSKLRSIPFHQSLTFNAINQVQTKVT